MGCGNNHKGELEMAKGRDIKKEKTKKEPKKTKEEKREEKRNKNK